MFEHLLIASDGSELADRALLIGLQLSKAHGSKITVVTSTDPIETGLGTGGFGTFDAKSMIEKLEAIYSSQAAEIVEAARKKAAESNIKIDSVYVPGKRASDAIIDTANKVNCDVIIMGSHGRRGLQKLLLGSQAAAVLATSQVPVLIVK